MNDLIERLQEVKKYFGLMAVQQQSNKHEANADTIREACIALEQAQTENKRLTKQLADVASYEGATQRKRIEKLKGELKIKSEFLSSRQCPDHSGKWQRGNCLQCRIEQIEAALRTLCTCAELGPMTLCLACKVLESTGDREPAVDEFGRLHDERCAIHHGNQCDCLLSRTAENSTSPAT